MRALQGQLGTGISLFCSLFSFFIFHFFSEFGSGIDDRSQRAVPRFRAFGQKKRKKLPKIRSLSRSVSFYWGPKRDLDRVIVELIGNLCWWSETSERGSIAPSSTLRYFFFPKGNSIVLHSTYARKYLVLAHFFSFSRQSCILPPTCFMSLPDLESRVVIIISNQINHCHVHLGSSCIALTRLLITFNL